MGNSPYLDRKDFFKISYMKISFGMDFLFENDKWMHPFITEVRVHLFAKLMAQACWNYSRLYTLMKMDVKLWHQIINFKETTDTSFESPDTALFAFELKNLKIFDVKFERPSSSGPSIIYMSVCKYILVFFSRRLALLNQ